MLDHSTTGSGAGAGLTFYYMGRPAGLYVQTLATGEHR
jgi:hypothetical protein